jgi:hypothetical protein
MLEMTHTYVIERMALIDDLISHTVSINET